VIQLRSRSNLPSILDASRQQGVWFFDRLRTAADVGSVVLARQRMPSQRGIDCRAAFLEASPIEKGGRGNFCNEQAQRSEHIYEA
jgi:hypothetical protein